MSEARFRKIITGMTIKTQTQYHIIMKAVSSQSRRHPKSQETHPSKQTSSNNVLGLFFYHIFTNQTQKSSFYFSELFFSTSHVVFYVFVN